MKRSKSIQHDLPKRVENNLNHPLPPGEIEDGPYILEGEGMKNIIPSEVIDIRTRLEVLPGVNLFGHTDTLTEAFYFDTNFINESYEKGEIQNEQQYRNSLNKINTI